MFFVKCVRPFNEIRQHYKEKKLLHESTVQDSDLSCKMETITSDHPLLIWLHMSYLDKIKQSSVIRDVMLYYITCPFDAKPYQDILSLLF